VPAGTKEKKMNNQQTEINVKNLCSRKLWELLKNAEWQTASERFAIEQELSGRRHYLEELQTLSVKETMH
jgi:hypothetical protein|tara:strand:+ start:354 stop:563 length:210 start_codon:yes stop_codon:yes gene_type:complete